jgi:RNA polymerase sigma-70 factor (ECF subfamily)
MGNDLIEKILSGDTQAVVDFYNAYSPRMLRYLIKRLPRKEDAQELANDIFLEAVDSLPTLKSHARIEAWLFGIAHYKTADFYRKRKIKSFLFSQVPYFELIAGEINQPEFITEKNKLRDKIETTLHSLSDTYEQILRMHYEENMPVKAIAVILHMSQKAAESRLFRARQCFIKAYERA